MAALTKQNFSEMQPEELCLFGMPSTQTAVEKTYFQHVRPISQITGNSPVEFNVNSTSSLDYVDMKNSRLFVKLKVIRADGKLLDEADNVGPVNLLLQSLWSQVEVSLQGKVVTTPNANYGYNAYIQTLLKSSGDEKSSTLTSQLYHLDQAGKMDSTNVNTGVNEGLFARGQYIANSQSVSLEGPLYHPLFQQRRYILNQTDIHVKLFRQRPSFCLMAPDGEYDIVLEDVVLKVAKVRLNPAVILAHGQVLQSSNAKYPLVRSEIKMFSLPAGQISCHLDNMFQNNRPSKIAIGFVSSEAAAGDITKNPYNFDHFDLSSISLLVDGESVGGNAIKTNFVDEFSNVTPFLNQLDTFNRGAEGNGLNCLKFAQGYALYAFNLDADFPDENCINLLHRGNVALECQFSKPLEKTVTCVVYAETGDYYEINQSRDIILE